MLLGFAIAFLGAVVAIAPAYLLLLTIAAFTDRTARRPERPISRLTVLVPAHDEATLITRCVASLLDQDYPTELFRIVVIADNCSDDTATLATHAGARVLERSNPKQRGKGYALRWAMDRLLGEPDPPDAVVVVDADSVFDPQLLRELEAAFQSGADAVQAEYLVLDEPGARNSGLVSVGFLLFHRVRLAGRAALGLPSSLVGNGMLLSRNLLRSHPWDAFTGAEDLEYSLNLSLAGVRVAFAPGARVLAPMPAAGSASRRQRLRWEGGRFHQVRTRLGAVVLASIRRRDVGLLSMAGDLAVPPLGILALLVSGGAGISLLLIEAGAVPGWAGVTWFAAGGLLAGHVLGGLLAARAPASAYLMLLRAPLFLASKLVVYGRLAAGFDAKRWERTERPGEVASRGERVDVAGVLIDAVTKQEALDRMRGALGSKQLYQVATINLDFLVRAQVDPEVREIFRRTSLNVADGAPVVWLGRLLHGGLPERVAGADLVPEICEVAALVGAPVFLLGGEGGAAAAAASVLLHRYPGLKIAGHLEPPHSPVAEMDLEATAALINDSGADVLLVALGHPKQERWIDLNRGRLNVSLAMGVGCAFDLLAGRRRRAPRWMQGAGLEWLFRVAQEPKRLLGRYAVDATWLLRLTTLTLLRRLA